MKLDRPRRYRRPTRIPEAVARQLEYFANLDLSKARTREPDTELGPMDPDDFSLATFSQLVNRYGLNSPSTDLSPGCLQADRTGSAATIEREYAKCMERFELLQSAAKGLLQHVGRDGVFGAVRGAWLPAFRRCAQAGAVEAVAVQPYWEDGAGNPLAAEKTAQSKSLPFHFGDAFARAVVETLDWLNRPNACAVCGEPADGFYCGRSCAQYAYRERRDKGEKIGRTNI